MSFKKKHFTTTAPSERLTRLLNGSAALYVISVLLATPVEGLSWLAHVTLGLLLISLTFIAHRNGLHIPRDPILGLSILFVGYMFSSCLWATDIEIAFVRSISTGFAILGFLAILLAYRNGLDLNSLLYGLVIGATINAIIAWYQYNTYDLMRVAGLVGNANALAIQLGTVSMILVTINKNRRILIILLATGLLLVATIVSGSRKILFAWPFFLLILSMPWLNGLRKSSSRIATLIFLIPFIIGITVRLSEITMDVVGDVYAYQRMERFFEGRDNSGNTRLYFIQVGYDIWKDAPLTGHGNDQFRVLSRAGTYSHNNYIELLVNLGFIGLVLFLSIYVILLYHIRLTHSLKWQLNILIMLISIWDIAMVSYTAKSHWLILAIIYGITGKLNNENVLDTETRKNTVSLER